MRQGLQIKIMNMDKNLKKDMNKCLIKLYEKPNWNVTSSFLVHISERYILLQRHLLSHVHFSLFIIARNWKQISINR